MLRTLLPVAAALGLATAACTPLPPQSSASLPGDAMIGAGDPLRAAVANTSNAFGSPERLAGRPGQAARALAQMEFLAVEIQGNPRLYTAAATSPAEFATARQEWRSALGVPLDVPPQPVIDGLYASARAMGGGGEEAAAAALPASVFPLGGRATLARLAALPPLPATNRAAISATEAMRQQDNPGRGQR